MAIISVKDIQVNYGPKVALKHISFDIEKNEFIGIIGPNGGGKTTLIKTLLGILKPSSGKIEVASSEIIGYVPQLATFDRDFPITVRDVILTGHLPKEIKIGQGFNKEEKEHALSAMKALEIEELGYRQIGTLSGGQMQKVLIARALMNHPTVLILDEPAAGIDEASKQDIYRMFKELSEYMTILMVTHDTADLIDYFDRMFYINQTIHLHQKPESGIKTKENCPIDWFVKGEEIQKLLLDSKGAEK